jgi:xanthine dehydrogenase molybdenum-binding subunit
MTREETHHVVGRDLPRKDGVARVTGRELYPSDMTLPGMLHGRVLRSPHPHARIRSIDVSGAEALGAVVLTWKDTPRKVFNVRQVSVPRSTYQDWQILSDHMRQVGDAFGAVAAESEELAQRAAEAVKVEWEILPAYLSIEQSLKAEDNLIHDKVYLQDREIEIQNNIACTREVAEGDVVKGFAEAEVIVENEFVTPRVYHCQLETKACLCRPEPDGGVTLWPTTQALHNTRILVGDLFGIPLNKVNVVRVTGGGHFGSGIQTNPATMICVALALKACRPVRIVQTRE